MWDIYILIRLCPNVIFFSNMYLITRATLIVWHIGPLCEIINCGLKKVRLRENRLTLGATWARPDGGRGPRHRPVTSGDETRRLKRSSMEIGAVAPSSVNGCPFLDLELETNWPAHTSRVRNPVKAARRSTNVMKVDSDLSNTFHRSSWNYSHQQGL